MAPSVRSAPVASSSRTTVPAARARRLAARSAMPAASTSAWRPSRASVRSASAARTSASSASISAMRSACGAVDGGLEVLPGLRLRPRPGVAEVGLEALALGGELLDADRHPGELLQQGVGGDHDALGLVRLDGQAQVAQRVGEGGDEVVLGRAVGRDGEVAQRPLEVLALVGDGGAPGEQHPDGLDLDVLELVEQGVVVGIVLEGGGDLGPGLLSRIQLGLGGLQAGLGALVDAHEAGAHDVGAPGREPDPIEDLLLADEGGGELALAGPGPQPRRAGARSRAPPRGPGGAAPRRRSTPGGGPATPPPRRRRCGWRRAGRGPRPDRGPRPPCGTRGRRPHRGGGRSRRPGPGRWGAGRTWWAGAARWRRAGRAPARGRGRSARARPASTAARSASRAATSSTRSTVGVVADRCGGQVVAELTPVLGDLVQLAGGLVGHVAEDRAGPRGCRGGGGGRRRARGGARRACRAGGRRPGRRRRHHGSRRPRRPRRGGRRDARPDRPRCAGRAGRGWPRRAAGSPRGPPPYRCRAARRRPRRQRRSGPVDHAARSSSPWTTESSGWRSRAARSSGSRESWSSRMWSCRRPTGRVERKTGPIGPLGHGRDDRPDQPTGMVCAPVAAVVPVVVVDTPVVGAAAGCRTGRGGRRPGGPTTSGAGHASGLPGGLRHHRDHLADGFGVVDQRPRPRRGTCGRRRSAGGPPSWRGS